MKTFFITAIALCTVLNPLWSQDVSYEIPLSEPGKPGTLKIDVYNAAIKVSAHTANTVELYIKDRRIGFGKKKGSAEFYYQILEEDNNIIIVNRDASKTKGLSLELKVPKDFSVNLATYFGPTLEVSGLEGEVEVKGYFTDLLLKNLTGSIIASTNQGKILVDLNQVFEDNTYFLSAYKKNLELILPKDAQASFLMNNNFGKFESDFKLQLAPRNPIQVKDNYVTRMINGGGAQFKLVNYFGRILIRSKLVGQLSDN